MLAAKSFTWIATCAFLAFTDSVGIGPRHDRLRDAPYIRLRACNRLRLLAHICQAIYTPAMRRTAKPFPLDLLFRALADRTRLRLLNLIADKEICVCYFVDILHISQPKISRHLAY